MPDLSLSSQPDALGSGLEYGLDTNLVPLFLLRYDATNTKRAYSNDLTQFFGSDVVTLRMARAVTFVDVNEHLGALAAAGASPSTVQRRVSALRGFFAWLAALGLLELNPADRHLVRRTQRTRRRDRVITFLTLEESRALVASSELGKPTDVRDRTLIQVLIHCVLRRSEARAMDFDHIRPVGHHWVLDLPSTKGGADQYVKIPDHIARSVVDMKRFYGLGDGPVWRSMSNNSRGRRLSTTSIYNIVRSAAVRAGLKGNIGAHTLRHTGCTLAIEAGASLQQVQHHARHKSLETTMIYVHQRDRLNDSAADYIDV